jgi:chromosome segregation ATPase
MIYSQLSEHFAKLQAEIQIQYSAKLQSEQDLQKIKAENIKLSNEIKELKANIEELEENKIKSNIQIEELTQNNGSLFEKNEKYQKENIIHKKRIDEMKKEIDALNEKMVILSQKYESLTFELEKNQRKFLNEERNSKITISQLKENNDNLKKQIDYLQEKVNESEGLVITDNRNDLESIINEKNEIINVKDVKITKLEKNIRTLENSLITKREEIAKLNLKLQQNQNIKLSVEDQRNKIILQLSNSLESLKKELYEMKFSFSKNLKSNLSYFIGFVTSLKRIIDKKNAETNLLNARFNSFSEKEKNRNSESILELQEKNKALFIELDQKV